MVLYASLQQEVLLAKGWREGRAQTEVVSFMKYAAAVLGWLSWHHVGLRDTGGTNLAITSDTADSGRPKLCLFDCLDWVLDDSPTPWRWSGYWRMAQGLCPEAVPEIRSLCGGHDKDPVAC